MDQYKGPAFDEIMPELFQAFKELGGSGTVNEIDRKTIEILQLSPEVIEYPHRNSNKTELEYRLAWTRAYMKKVGILENSSRGVWALTSKGGELNTVDPASIVKQVRTMSFLSLPSANMNRNDENPENDGIDVPDEIQRWRDKLKNILVNLTLDAFERLSQRLLRESGFSQVEVTGRTGDGGIDGTGTIKLNGMISFHMLFQCKRYQGSVSAGELRDFRGAMQGRADKGLFITTGRFTSGAVHEANRPGTTPIDLLDGDELIDKLKDLRLGVIPVEDYQIDDAWFASI